MGKEPRLSKILEPNTFWISASLVHLDTPQKTKH